LPGWLCFYADCIKFTIDVTFFGRSVDNFGNIFYYIINRRKGPLPV